MSDVPRGTFEPTPPGLCEGEIDIGDFRLVRRTNGALWLEWASGEDMEVDEKKLEHVLNKFWNENF